MTDTFGDDSLGWMRIAKLDVNHCPQGLKANASNTIYTCVVTEDNAGCIPKFITLKSLVK